MTSNWKVMKTLACLSLLLPLTGIAQVDFEEPGAQSSIGFRAGYGLPVGEWAKSRVAPEIQYFTGDLACEGDISIRLGQKWAVVIGGGYMRLNGSKWEEYARSSGDNVSISGSMTNVSFSFRPYLLASPSNQIAFELGAIGLFASGEEEVNGQTYNYDFFSSFRIGLQGALEYDRIMSEAVALTFRVGAVVVPDGMNYADGESRTIIYVPMTAGIRFLF